MAGCAFEDEVLFVCGEVEVGSAAAGGPRPGGELVYEVVACLNKLFRGELAGGGESGGGGCGGEVVAPAGEGGVKHVLWGRVNDSGVGKRSGS